MVFVPLRDENRARIDPLITVGLIAIMAIAFFWQTLLDQEGQDLMIRSFGLIPAELFGMGDPIYGKLQMPRLLTVFSSVLLHGGLLHLFANALFLWIFGNNVEDAMGHSRFFVFFFTCGAVAALAHALVQPGSVIPMIGASGAVGGVLGAYLVLFPRSRLLVFAFPFLIRLPAWLVLITWFGVQGVSAVMADPDAGGVAWWAHIGGFIAGMVLVRFFRKSRPAPPPAEPGDKA
jgi:membrane associated rhomboid family serine protease